ADGARIGAARESRRSAFALVDARERIERPAGGRANLEVLVLARAQAAIASVRDHRGIVGAELGARIEHAHVALLAERAQPLAQALVRADAARDDERRQLRLIQRACALESERFDDRLLELIGEIRAHLVVELYAARGNDDRGLQPAEAEIESGPIEHRARELEAAWLALLGELRERGAAGVWQAKKLRGFVECFARGIVDGRADDLILAEPAHFGEQRVAARHEQREE